MNVSADRVAVGLPTQFAPEALAAYILDPQVIEHWLAAGATLPTERGSESRVPLVVNAPTSVGTVLAPGVVEEAGWSHDGLRLVVAFNNVAGQRLRINVTPQPAGGSYLRVVALGLTDPAARRVALREWQAALNRLAVLLADLERARRRVRQAVIVVHGIGEQRPGQTLRRFVAAVFPESAEHPRYFKPDYVSSLFELRSVSVPGDRATRRPTTDVYELYWAHLVRDTTLGQVYGWGLRLLLTPLQRVTASLRTTVLLLRFLFALLVLEGVIFFAWQPIPRWAVAGTIATLGVLPGLFWAVARSAQRRFVLGFAGDAARYLEPLPGNIELRQKIREAGVDLIDNLHDSGRYARIIVYGHSLGSVIAYDILSQSWVRRSRVNASGRIMTAHHLRAVEDLLNPRQTTATPQPIDLVQGRQHAAWREYRRNGFDWRVSDLVTAGSPLVHARWLLNLDRHTSFEELTSDRSFPTCPPQTEDAKTATPGRLRKAFTFTHSYPDPQGEGSRSVLVPHHAAMFAVTRWTNLYFPQRAVVSGDPVGGPLRTTFGPWIRDESLTAPRRGFAHNQYVAVGGDRMHLDQLRGALALPSELDLFDLAALAAPTGPAD